jgi:hypothetical protein
MASLKPYIFKLAPQLGMSPAALYERQRALVRAGLLEQGTGRGPGSGVQANASTVALLLIAALATDNLSDANVRTREIATTKQQGDLSRLMKGKTFHEAVTTILGGYALPWLVTKLRIFQSARQAEIHLGQMVVLFGAPAPQKLQRLPGVRVMAEIDGEILRQISADLAALRDDDATSRSAKERQD